MNSDSHTSNVSFGIGRELAVVTVLDGKGQCLSEVHSKVLWESREDGIRENFKGKITSEPDFKV